MVQITEKDLDSELKGISVRLPKLMANKIKAEASLLGMSRDDYIKDKLLNAING